MAMYLHHHYRLSPQPSPVTHIKIVYVHGFLGSIKTFKDLPTQLRNSLHARYPNILVDNNIYIYETKGRYKDAPRNLYNAVWTCIQTRWRYDLNPLIIFIGHSMGGLVAADTIRMIDNSGWPAFPNNARVIGLLAYDTPYFSIDREFIKAGLKTVTTVPLSTAIHLYMTKISDREKGTLHRLGELAATAVKKLNHGVSFLMDKVGKLTVRAFIAAAILLAAFAFYVFKEVGYDSYHQERYPENYVVIPDYRDEPTLHADNPEHHRLYACKVFDYLTFAYENFRSDEKLDARVLDLRNNPNIKFRCIYNIVPKLQLEKLGDRPHTQFIRTKDNGFCGELFQALLWPADPFGRTRPQHFNGGAESVLAHIQMFGVPQGGPNEPNPTLNRLLYLSADFLVHIITSHINRQRNVQYSHVYQ